METALRTLVLFAFAGAVVSVAAWATAVYLDARRRLRRALKRALGAEPEAEIIAPRQGRAAGVDFGVGGLAVLWDHGAAGLVYRFEEIEGAELIINGEVRARVRRDEPPKPLDHLDPLAEDVVLRLVFDTPRWPEFELDLHDHAGPGEEAVRDGRRWLAHVQAVLRKTARRQAKAAAAPAPAERAEAVQREDV